MKFLMRRASRLFDLLLDFLAVLSGVMLCILVTGIAVEVAIRALDLGTITGGFEVAEYMLFAMTFFAAPWALRQGAHIRVDFVVATLPPQMTRSCEIIADILGCAVSGVITFYGVRVVAQSYESGTLVYKSLVFPEWWILWPIPLGAACLLLEFVRRIARCVQNEETNRSSPSQMPGL